MRKILCTDYSSRICTELNCNGPNFILFYFLFYLTYLRRHFIVRLMYSCVLTAFNLNEYQLIMILSRGNVATGKAIISRCLRGGFNPNLLPESLVKSAQNLRENY